MNEFEQYFENLFKDPAFGFVLGIASIWYSYYLYNRPLNNNDLCFITMSNYHKKNPRQTEMVLLNESDRDITRDDILEGYPLLIKFSENIHITEFIIKMKEKSVGSYTLTKKSATDYEFKFDIIKRGQGIVMIAIHDSKKHMDLTWKDISISGTLKNFDLTRDDFSDQMIYRANSVYIPIYIGCFLVATVFAFAFKTFFAAGNINLPYLYIFIWGLILSYFSVADYFLSKVGNTRYKNFWKLIKASR